MPESKASPQEQSDFAAAAELCRREIRNIDPDRYFASLFARPEHKRALWALYGFNLEVAKIREIVSDPMIGQIRLQWWREAIEMAETGAIREHFAVKALATLLRHSSISAGSLHRIIDARAFDLDEEPPRDTAMLYDYAGDTAGELMALICGILDPDNPPLAGPARNLGIAWALCGLVRAAPHHFSQGKSFIPAVYPNADPYKKAPEIIAEIADRADQAVSSATAADWGRKHRPLTVLFPLIRRDLRQIRQLIGDGRHPAPQRPFPRQIRMCCAAWLGF